MSYDLDTLFNRLPAEIRKRDRLEGIRTLTRQKQWDQLAEPAEYGPIRNLLAVMLREGQIIQRDIDQLYDDHFIETCADWVVPYIGKLIGAPVLEEVPGTDGHRRFVGAVLKLNRAKGTPAALEYAAAAASGLPVIAVEYWRRTAVTVSLRRPRHRPEATLDVRDLARMDRIGSPFSTVARTMDSRSVETQQGRWNLPNIGLHLFHTHTVEVGNTGRDAASGGPATVDAGHWAQKAHSSRPYYRFHPLGGDAPVFNPMRRAATPVGRLRRQDETAYPIGRFELRDQLDPSQNQNIDAVFGPQGIMNIAVRVRGRIEEVDPATVKAANLAAPVDPNSLEDWPVEPVAGTTFIDPETGRIILDMKYARARGVYVSWHEGRVHDIGGGPREASEIMDYGGAATVAMDGVRDREAVPNPLPTSSNPLNVVFERSTAYRFDGVHNIQSSDADFETNIVAEEGAWPTIQMLDTSGLQLNVPDGSRLRLSGLRFFKSTKSGPFLTINGDDVDLYIEDCTLTPGHSVDPAGHPRRPGEPTLVIGDGMSVHIVRSVLGPIRMGRDAELTLEDCIVDAGRPEGRAIGPVDDLAGQRISIIRSTIIGGVQADSVGGPNHYADTASHGGARISVLETDTEIERPRGIRDSLIIATSIEGEAPVDIRNTQSGCVSHSFIPPASRTPRRFACIPHPGTAADAVHWPVFHSRRFTDPAYLALAHGNRDSVMRGASNGAAMGVGNRRGLPARLRNVRTIIDHYSRFGFQAGPIHHV